MVSCLLEFQFFDLSPALELSLPHAVCAAASPITTSCLNPLSEESQVHSVNM